MRDNVYNLRPLPDDEDDPRVIGHRDGMTAAEGATADEILDWIADAALHDDKDTWWRIGFVQGACEQWVGRST